MRRRLLVFLSALATVLAVIPAATAGTGTLAAQAQDRGGAALTEVSGAITAGASIHLDSEVLKSSDRVPVIIKLDEQPVASYDGGVAGLTATNPRLTGDTRLDLNSLSVQRYQRYLQGQLADFENSLEAAVDGATVTHNYDLVVGGVAAIVPGSSLTKIAKMSGVVAVYPDTLNELLTDSSPEWIGAPTLWNSLGGQDDAGEGIIVAAVDSGIWPEHPSVSDPDPAGEAYAAPPAHWAGTGTGAGCDFGDTAFNPGDDPFTCNNKLLGAYDFTATYVAINGLIPTEYHSARDSNGHGSHTLTTAAGNGGVAATLLGVPRGEVSGIAPRAHVVAYKGCGLTGCFSSDTSAAIQQAVADGVDVVNYSISGGSDPYNDVVSLAMLDAYNGGTLVVPSAGNSGPGADTVAHREPWSLTTGASTSDRHFLATVTLTADNDDTLELTGASLTGGIAVATPVIFPPAGQEQCENTPGGEDPFPAGTFAGEIVVCDRGGFARVAKSFNVSEGGAGGMLLVNLVPQGLSTDNHFIPSIHLENNDGDALKAFMAAHTGVTATTTDSTTTAVQGDVMAPFSSRGGSLQTLGISKPDVTAPGVQILAAHTPTPENQDGGLPGELFQAIQGTSMSAPHATGSAALVKAAHPDWTPGQIKSALMMTAKQDGVTKEDGVTPADAFDYGSGRVDLTQAHRARVTISETGANFLAMQDHLWDANYPSLYVPVFAGQNTVARTFENMTNFRQVYDFEIDKPDDLIVRFGVLRDGKFRIKKNGRFGVAPNSSKTHHIKVDGRNLAVGETRHATITMTNRRGNETLVFPITVVRQQAGVSLDKTCAPSSIGVDEFTTCTITAQNNTFETENVNIADRLPRELGLDRSSVEGETKIKANGTIRFIGPLGGATPPAPSVAVDPLASPFGYLALAGFGGTIDVGATDESIANFTVPSFEYAGVSYSTIGIVSNGYAIVGGGTGADVNFINSDLPDAAIPNNVLAPFWTDLNPAFGGRVLINVLSNGVDTWTVLEWENVRSFGDVETTTTQIWLGTDTDTNPGEDISFVYGADVSDGDGGFLTVGAENAFGNEGGTVYFDGVGDAPAPSFPVGDYEVDVLSIPGAPGEIAEITFNARGKFVGDWTNYVKMWSTAFPGKSWASASGEVTEGGGGG